MSETKHYRYLWLRHLNLWQKLVGDGSRIKQKSTPIPTKVLNLHAQIIMLTQDCSKFIKFLP